MEYFSSVSTDILVLLQEMDSSCYHGNYKINTKHCRQEHVVTYIITVQVIDLTNKVIYYSDSLSCSSGKPVYSTIT